MVYPDSKHSDPLKIGADFEAQASDIMRRLYGISLHPSIGKQRQLAVGENDEGYEFKLDQRSAHSHRISIEVGEKSRANLPTFTRSGILRNDNTAFYVQGFWDFAWIFRKTDLIVYYRNAKPRVISDDPATIQKFYVSFNEANKLACHLFAMSPRGVAWYPVCEEDSPPINSLLKNNGCLHWSRQLDGHCTTRAAQELRLYLDRIGNVR